MKKIFRIIMILMMIGAILQIVPHEAFAKGKNTNLSMHNNGEENKDIVDIAIADGRFKTLTGALQAANLVDTLKGEGPFTVFAPTDDAFAKLSANTINDLLKPENKDQLANILKYHVAPGKILASDVMRMNGKEIKMANGEKAKIEIKNNEAFIDGAKIIVTDIMGKNGVIHVIDTVIMP